MPETFAEKIARIRAESRAARADVLDPGERVVVVETGAQPHSRVVRESPVVRRARSRSIPTAVTGVAYE